MESVQRILRVCFSRAILVDVFQAWINEKNAPEILPYESEAMEACEQAISTQEREIRETEDSTNPSENITRKFLTNLYEMEVTVIIYTLISRFPD